MTVSHRSRVTPPVFAGSAVGCVLTSGFCRLWSAARRCTERLGTGQTCSIRLMIGSTSSQSQCVPPGPKIYIPAWVFCMSWCADLEFWVTQHSIGWLAHAIIIRDWSVWWMASFLFEMMEVSPSLVRHLQSQRAACCDNRCSVCPELSCTPSELRRGPMTSVLHPAGVLQALASELQRVLVGSPVPR